MSFSAGEPGIAQKENSSDDQRHRRLPRIISSLPMAFGFFRPAGTCIGFGWATMLFRKQPVRLSVRTFWFRDRTFTGGIQWIFFRVADQNEAAGAADATRGVEEKRSASTASKVGSQGGPCDPTTQNDAGGTPAS